MPNVFDEKISKNYCSNCGACVYICPTGALAKNVNLPQFDPEKCIDCSLCINICPSNISLQVTNIEDFKIKGYAVKTTIDEIKTRAQDGGAVTSFILTALEEKLIEYALICGGSIFKPEPMITNNFEKVISSAGSKYFYAPILAELNKNILIKNSIGVVGLPCHLRALREIEKIIKRNIELKISLFCWRNYFYKYFREIISKVGIDNIQEILKIRIVQGKYIIEKNDGDMVSINVKNIAKYSSKACDRCGELFSLNADIAIGDIGSDIGWSTVIVLTEKGEKIFKKCLEKGYIVSKPLASDKIDLIKKMYKRKRKRIEKN